jgi:GTP-binding protein EngB required for normal cell division
VRLDAEVGGEFEARYQEFGVPLPLFVRSLLRGSSPDSVWQQAQQELLRYIDKQGERIDGILEIQRKIERCDRIIAEFANSTNPSKIMIARVAKEDKIKLQLQLEKLDRLAA